MLSDRERLIVLNLIPDVGSTNLRRLLDVFGDLEQIFKAGSKELQRVEGIGPMTAQRVAAGCRDERCLQQELALATQHGVTIVTLEDAAYPPSLKTIHDPPLALYVRGTLAPADEVAVGVVGARRASRYGFESAEQLSYDLALRGITVVSGLARGIDGAAHRGALKASGRTLAVLGNGLSTVYPPEHQELAEQIVQHGALMSEYPMSTPPWPQNFPRRNRIISGLSLGVVVVEAAQRSGALITADCALEQGREVFAVPGPMTAVTSQGTHHLVKQGARLVTSVEDILEELRLRPEPKTTSEHTTEKTLWRVTPEGRSLPPVPRPWLGIPRRGIPRPTAEGQPDDGDSPARRGRRGPAGGRTRLGGIGMTRLEGVSTTAAALPESEERVFACVSQEEPRYIDAIASDSGLATSEVVALLLQLELKRLVQQLPGKQFIKSP